MGPYARGEAPSLEPRASLKLGRWVWALARTGRPDLGDSLRASPKPALEIGAAPLHRASPYPPGKVPLLGKAPRVRPT